MDDDDDDDDDSSYPVMGELLPAHFLAVLATSNRPVVYRAVSTYDGSTLVFKLCFAPVHVHCALSRSCVPVTF